MLEGVIAAHRPVTGTQHKTRIKRKSREITTYHQKHSSWQQPLAIEKQRTLDIGCCISTKSVNQTRRLLYMKFFKRVFLFGMFCEHNILLNLLKTIVRVRNNWAPAVQRCWMWKQSPSFMTSRCLANYFFIIIFKMRFYSFSLKTNKETNKTKQQQQSKQTNIVCTRASIHASLLSTSEMWNVISPSHSFHNVISNVE